MAIYSIFRRPDDDAEKAVFVKDGFNFAALAFSVFWALWHRMWVVAAVVLAIMALLSLAASYAGMPEHIIALVDAALGLVLGFEAQSIRAWSLRRAGYAEAGVVKADCLDEAEMKYFMSLDRHSFTSAGAAPKLFPASHGDTLGLFGPA